MDLVATIIQTILALVLIIAVMVATPFLLMLVFSFAYSGPPPDAVRRSNRATRPAPADLAEDEDEDDENVTAIVPPRAQPDAGRGDRS